MPHLIDRMLSQKLKKMLNIPTLYLTYRAIVGGRKATSIFVRDYVRPKCRDRILDIGCGPAETVEHFSNVEYVGFDNNPAYIELAKKNFGDQGHFFCGKIDQVSLKDFEAFDLVLAVGVLHHLDDNESISLFKLAYEVLKDGGRLVTYDGCYVEGQSKIAQFIISQDRGRFIRKKDDYLNLARQVFKNVKQDLRDDLLRIPYTHLIMECNK